MKTRIVVHLEGGLVQSVSCNRPLTTEVAIVDYDTEGGEPEEIHHVPQSDDPTNTSEAFIDWQDMGTTTPSITTYLDKIS